MARAGDGKMAERNFRPHAPQCTAARGLFQHTKHASDGDWRGIFDLTAPGAQRFIRLSSSRVHRVFSSMLYKSLRCLQIRLTVGAQTVHRLST